MIDHERDIDGEPLVELVGGDIVRDPTSALWSDPRFVDWAAAEVRARRGRGATRDDELLAAGSEMLARVRARRLRVARVDGRPDEREPAARGGPAQVLALASRERASPLVDLAVAAGVGRELWDEPVERWIDLPEGLAPGQYLALRISGDSMAPLVHTGDTVLVRTGTAVRGDSVVIARHPDDGYVCKMVRRIHGASIELASLDPARPAIVIPRDDGLIIGAVVLVWCHHRAPTRATPATAR